MARHVVTVLGPSSYSRIGYRLWYLYPTDTLEDATDRLMRIGLVRADLWKSLSKSGLVERPSLTGVVDRSKFLVRVGIGLFEQKVNVPPELIRQTRIRARDQARNQRQALIDQLHAQRMIDRFPKYGLSIDLD